MIVTGIAPSEAVTQSRAKSREQKQAEQQPSGFSSRHIILDLSLEAWKQIGHEPQVSARTLPLPLYIYNDAGDFAYGDAARRYEEAQQRVMSRVEIERLRTITAVEAAERAPEITAASIPNFVAFDGMLSSGPAA